MRPRKARAISREGRSHAMPVARKPTVEQISDVRMSGLRPSLSEAWPIHADEMTLPPAHVEMTSPTVEAVPPKLLT